MKTTTAVAAKAISMKKMVIGAVLALMASIAIFVANQAEPTKARVYPTQATVAAFHQNAPLVPMSRSDTGHSVSRTAVDNSADYTAPLKSGVSTFNQNQPSTKTLVNSRSGGAFYVFPTTVVSSAPKTVNLSRSGAGNYRATSSTNGNYGSGYYPSLGGGDYLNFGYPGGGGGGGGSIGNPDNGNQTHPQLPFNGYGGTPGGNGQDTTLWVGLTCSNDGVYVFACGKGRMISVSDDGGTTWKACGEIRNYSGISVSGTGQYGIATVFHGGVYATKDFGQTWKAEPGLKDADYSACAISKDGLVRTLTVSGGNIFTSKDGGKNYRLVASPRDWRGVTLSVYGELQVAVDAKGYPNFSVNSGVDWKPVGSLVSSWSAVTMSIDSMFGLYADGKALYRWEKFDLTPILALNVAAIAVATDRYGLNSLVTDGKALYESFDYSHKWRTIVAPTRTWAVIAMAAEVPQRIYVAEQNGAVWSSYEFDKVTGNRIWHQGVTNADAPYPDVAPAPTSPPGFFGSEF